MSTISSQLIVTSSALIEDLYKVLLRKNGSDREYVFLGRMAVLLVSIIAMVLALEPDSTILDLVAYAWAGFGGAFGPVILLSLFWRKMTTWGALAGMITGAVTVILWANLTKQVLFPFSYMKLYLAFLSIYSLWSWSVSLLINQTKRLKRNLRNSSITEKRTISMTRALMNNSSAPFLIIVYLTLPR